MQQSLVKIRVAGTVTGKLAIRRLYSSTLRGMAVCAGKSIGPLFFGLCLLVVNPCRTLIVPVAPCGKWNVAECGIVINDQPCERR